MPHGPGAAACGSGGNGGSVKNRERRQRLALRDNFVLEPRSGIARTGHAGVTLYGIIVKAKFKSPERAPFEQPVDVLVPRSVFEPIFDFEYAALHGFRGGRKGWPVGHGGDDVRGRLRR